MTEETAQDIRSELGTVIMVDSKSFEFDQVRFLRIRINTPLNQPLWWGSLVINPKEDRFVMAFKYESLVGLCFACGHLGHKKKHCTLLNTSPQQQTNPYGEWMKASAGRHGHLVDDKPTSPPHWRHDSANETEPPRQSAQPRVSAVDPDTDSRQALLLTLEPVHPHGKKILSEKDDFMENILTKTHEDSPKYTCIILGHVSTITQALSMNPPNACHVPDHQTDLLPTVETSTYMHCMDSPLVAHPKLPTWIKIVLP